MKNIWKIINSPIIVVLLAILVWPILTVLSSGIAVRLGLEQIADAVSDEIVKPFQKMSNEQNEKTKIIISTLERIQIENLAFAPTSWQGKMKIIGTLRNNSDKTISSIKVGWTAFHNGKMVNVGDEWLSKIQAIRAGESENFYFNLDVENGQDKDNMKAEVKVLGIDIVE